MHDYVTDFMIVLEDQYEFGDLNTVGAITGRVGKVNLRTTVLRDLEGRVHFIPNGEIKSVTSRAYVWGPAVLEIPIGLRQDVDRIMGIILEVDEKSGADPEFSGWIMDKPVMLDRGRFSEHGMIVKSYAQTPPDKLYQTKRELLRRIKKRFDGEGIEIAVPHRILLQPADGENRVAQT
jgi:small conductance mechanosensitive channel